MTNEDAFNSTIHRVSRPDRHHVLLESERGGYLARVGGECTLQNHVDDAAIWDVADGGFRHVTSGALVAAGSVALNAPTTVDGDGTSGTPCVPRHGPAELPSSYLATMREQGWVALPSVLSPETVDALERVGCTGPWSDQQQTSRHSLNQDPAVARATIEPVSLWVTRQYMGTDDIRFGHPPTVSAMTPDDGERSVQGWHSDFPYLWGIPDTVGGNRVPTGSGELVLGVQRNICVSDFRAENGATVFKLGSHALQQCPPEEWGLFSATYKAGHRAKHGLPYGGPETDVIEAPGGSILLYDARTWHRAGVNRTNERRGAILQVLIPSYIIPFVDNSEHLLAFLETDAAAELNARELGEISRLMTQQIVGPQGTFAIGINEAATRRMRDAVTASG